MAPQAQALTVTIHPSSTSTIENELMSVYSSHHLQCQWWSPIVFTFAFVATATSILLVVAREITSEGKAAAFTSYHIQKSFKLLHIVRFSNFFFSIVKSQPYCDVIEYLAFTFKMFPSFFGCCRHSVMRHFKAISISMTNRRGCLSNSQFWGNTVFR